MRTFFVILWIFHCWDPRFGISDPVVHRVADDPDADYPLFIMASGAWLPYSPLAPALGLSHSPGLYRVILIAILLA